MTTEALALAAQTFEVLSQLEKLDPETVYSLRGAIRYVLHETARRLTERPETVREEIKT